MKKYNFPLSMLLLSLLILFSFFTIVKAQEDYELIIITPHKYETIAQQFLALHDDGSDWTIHGVYATVEDIFARYDKDPDGVDGADEPSRAGAPPVPATPGTDQIGKDYANNVSLSIIKFLRGILEFPPEVDNDIEGRDEYLFAFDVLRDATGAHIWIGVTNAKFKYLFILGETGAAGPANVTLNGVPESWYPWMDPVTYGEETGADNSYFPTDFFYSSPDYYGGIDWVPNLIVGRLPIHNFRAASDSGFVTEINVIDPDDIVPTSPYNPPAGLEECDVCDSVYATQPDNRWTPSEWAGYELWIVSDGNPPDPAGTGTLAPVGATYLILDNNDTCLRVLGNPSADGLEAETPATLTTPLIPGDGYEIHDAGLVEAQAIYNKCEAYDAEIKTNPAAWNEWFRKVVTAGGDSYPYLFSFWDEFVLADITNQGSFEGCEIIKKLRHTNKDNVPIDDDFTTTSFSPYLTDEDCGLLFHLGAGYGGFLYFPDDDNIITTNDVLGYTSSDSHIPIMVSNSDWSGFFDWVYDDVVPAVIIPSFGEAVVESPSGGGIAFIGATDTTYSGIIPFFNNGVVYQDRLFNMDELLSYTMESFHSAPKYLGDIFTGSPDLLGQGRGPINQFIANNEIGVDEEYWHIHKTVWEYTLLGDPVLPVPYPRTEPIETGTSAPGLAFNESTLRSQSPLYESHGIAVDEIPTGSTASTTLNITPENSPSAVPQVKITRVDIRRDVGKDYPAPASPANYTFSTPNYEPGYYLVRVEQPGYDPNADNWGSWWEKESWIYVQEVNQFTPTNSILVVDDDYGYPIVTNTVTDGYEDWYLKTLNDLRKSYDVWHVDFDDNNLSYPNGADDWNGVDVGTTLMHGEVYESLLANYAQVIWLTGDPSGYWRPNDYLHPTEGISIYNIETLTSLEQTYLENYLDNSGRLFLSGQGILDDLGCSGLTEDTEERFCVRTNGNIQNEFLTDYLHITDLYSAWARGYHPLLSNVAGNPVIGGNYTINIAGATGAENQIFFVDAEPDVDTPIVTRMFEYSSLSGAPEDIGDTPFFGTTGTCHYQGCGAHVFFPWGFEAINDQTKRNEVMGAVLAWLDSPTLTGPYVGCTLYCGNGICEPSRGENTTTCPADCPPGGGGGGGAGSLGGCFIATACYGTPMAEEVRVLSGFRDEYLMTNSLGRFFVRSYYKFSPPLAKYISERLLLKKFIRTGLKPLVHFSREK